MLSTPTTAAAARLNFLWIIQSGLYLENTDRTASFKPFLASAAAFSLALICLAAATVDPAIALAFAAALLVSTTIIWNLFIF